MNLYGIDNVRGGTYVTKNLDDVSRKFLQKELWMANDLCIRCGRNSHFVQNCYAKTTIDNQLLNENNHFLQEPSKAKACFGLDFYLLIVFLVLLIFFLLYIISN